MILSIGGASVDAPPDLDFRLATLGLGRKIPLTWLRDGRLRPSEIPLTEAPDDPPANTLRLSTRNLFDGPTVATINPRLPETYNLPLDAAGVVVVGMQGYPRNSGTQLGDILSVGDRQIRNSSDLAHATSGGPANWDITPGRGPLALRRRLRG